MPAQLPLTIEILGLRDGAPVVLDRVIGGSVSLDEAKRIGQRLLSIVDAETPPIGYRILSRDRFDLREKKRKREGALVTG
jgi:hypothetical protein